MVYMEAYDKLLESWLTLVQDEEHFPRGCFVQPAIQVFNSYIQCHLAAPDGTRNLVSLFLYCTRRILDSSICYLSHTFPEPRSVGERDFLSRWGRDQRAAGRRQRAVLRPAVQHWHVGTCGSWPLYPSAHKVNTQQLTSSTWCDLFQITDLVIVSLSG